MIGMFIAFLFETEAVIDSLRRKVVLASSGYQVNIKALISFEIGKRPDLKEAFLWLRPRESRYRRI
jgi:hypothetical protein